jgi:hypothetical protein
MHLALLEDCLKFSLFGEAVEQFQVYWVFKVGFFLQIEMLLKLSVCLQVLIFF